MARASTSIRAAGFPVKKTGIDYNKSGGLSSTVVFTYWTNFARGDMAKIGEFTLQTTPPSDSDPPGHWWSFVTNLDPEYLDIYMSPRDTQSFLFKMADIYRTSPSEKAN